MIIAGSRALANAALIERAVMASGLQITEVVSGKAPGIDTLGEDWAASKGIPVQPFPADWFPYGAFNKFAGRQRNIEMSEYADALIAIWDGKSDGTKHMIESMRRLGKPVSVLISA